MLSDWFLWFLLGSFWTSPSHSSCQVWVCSATCNLLGPPLLLIHLWISIGAYTLLCTSGHQGNRHQLGSHTTVIQFLKYIFYGLLCWSDSIFATEQKKLDRLFSKASYELSLVLENLSHPLLDTLTCWAAPSVTDYSTHAVWRRDPTPLPVAVSGQQAQLMD